VKTITKVKEAVIVNDPNKQNQQPGSERNAIPVGKNFVNALKSAISKNASPIDKLPSARDLLDCVVSQTMKSMSVPVYYRGQLQDDTYLWFDSEVAQRIQANSEIRDKRRFVEAAIGAYLGGAEWLRKHTVASREIRPRIIGDLEKQVIAKTAAEIADAKSVDSTFCPTSVPQFDPLAKTE
jgi:hypothetical protein